MIQPKILRMLLLQVYASYVAGVLELSETKARDTCKIITKNHLGVDCFPKQHIHTIIFNIGKRFSGFLKRFNVPEDGLVESSVAGFE